MKISRWHLVLIIGALLILGYVGYNFYLNQLLKAKTEAKELLKKDLTIKQQKALDSLKSINQNLRETLITEQNKPAVIIPRYNEKIIYHSVNDSTIINTLT